jgi:hypothetical protein
MTLCFVFANVSTQIEDHEMLAFIRRNSDAFSVLGILFFLTCLIWHACLHGGDFQVFYTAGERFLNHTPIYDHNDGWSPFKYHPAWAIVFSAWSLLPFTLSVLIFNIVNLTFWGLAARTWSQLLKYSFTPLSVLVLLILSINALSAETSYGQVNGLLFWGATLIFKWMEDSNPKPLRSGALLALLISLKLNLGILLFYVLFKNWRSALGLILGAAGLHLIVALSFKDLYAFELYRSWIDLLLFQSGQQFDTFEVQGVLRVCYILFGAQNAKIVWAGLLALAVLFGIFLDRFQQNEGPDKSVFNGCFWLAMVFFFSPLAWWYQVLYLFPLAFFLLKELETTLAQKLIRLCLGSFAFISFNTIGRNGIYNFKYYMGYFIIGMILWSCLIWTELKQSFSLRNYLQKIVSKTIRVSGPTSR